MVTLMVFSEAVGELSATSFGGLPVKNVQGTLDWPHCETCKGAMQYLGRIATDRGLAQIFMCGKDPGMCDDWDADGGGNKVIYIVSEELETVSAPAEGEVVRSCHHGAGLVYWDGDDYDAARAGWGTLNNGETRLVLGQMYGQPAWLQSDESPTCDHCGAEMRFVAQLEQGADWKTEMNFGGGGSAFLFDCSCIGSAKFLWQC